PRADYEEEQQNPCHRDRRHMSTKVEMNINHLAPLDPRYIECVIERLMEVNEKNNSIPETPLKSKGYMFLPYVIFIMTKVDTLYAGNSFLFYFIENDGWVPT
ncbi:hypothetical protein ACJX0J_006269, partial [Zea mays]